MIDRTIEVPYLFYIVHVTDIGGKWCVNLNDFAEILGLKERLHKLQPPYTEFTAFAEVLVGRHKEECRAIMLHVIDFLWKNHGIDISETVQ